MVTANPELKIVKPSFSEKFKSKNGPTISGVQTLLTALPILKIGDVDDLDPAASVRRRILDVRDVLRLGADPGRQAQHAARHRRRPRGAVPASQEDQAASAGAGLQAEQRVLFLHRTELRISTTPGMPTRSRPATWRKRIGCRQCRGGPRVSMATRSSSRRIRMPSSHTKWPTRSHGRTAGSHVQGSQYRPRPASGLLRLIGAKQDLT